MNCLINSPSKPVKRKQGKKSKVKLPNIFKEIVDAETGEPISIVPTKWDPIKGAIVIDTILSEKCSDVASEHSTISNASLSESSLSTTERRNPLFEEFMKHGPRGSIRSADTLSRSHKSHLTLSSHRSHSSPHHYGSNRSVSQGDISPFHSEDLDSNMTAMSSPRSESTERERERESHDRRENERERERSSLTSIDSILSTEKDLSRAERKLRRIYYKELLSLSSALVTDNRWKTFDAHFPSSTQFRAACKRIATLRAKHVTYLTRQVRDEEEKEREREKKEREVRSLPSRLIVLKNKHRDERERFRFYIQQVRHQNEVVLMTKMREEGFLW